MSSRIEGTNIRENELIALPDGRRLSYAEYGDPIGKAVLGFHGTPGSRFGLKVLSRPAAEHGLRLVVPDRPGYGLSDSVSRPTLIGYTEDVLHLANALRLERFGVIGISGGGPFALASAWKLSSRVKFTALISAIGPLYVPKGVQGMAKANRMMFSMSRRTRRLCNSARNWSSTPLAPSSTGGIKVIS